MSRRTFLRSLGLGGAAAALSYTGLGHLARLTAQGTVELEFWTPGGIPEFCQNFDAIAAVFEELHPNIDVLETMCGTGEENFNEVLLARIAAGSPPDVTIMWTSPAAFGARNALVAIDDYMATSEYSQPDTWPAGVLASCQFDGRTYGLPTTAGAYAFWYNATMFEELGIPSDPESFPTTWDELRRLSAEFTRWDGDTLLTAGYIPLRGDNIELAAWSALNGSQLFDPVNIRYTINSEENVEMMAYAVDWLREQYQGDPTLIAQSGNFTQDDSQGPLAWLEQRQAMMTLGFWGVGYPAMANSEFQWNVALYPVGPSGTETKSAYWPNWMVIPRGTSSPDEAFLWMDYLSVPGAEAWFRVVPDMPVNRGASTDLLPQALAEGKGEEFARQVSNFYRAQFDVATPMWNSPIENFATDQIDRAYERIMNGVVSPREGLDEAQAACQAELESVLSSA
jgi:ABC-type glycerol-3-phosphate transport system substrate-binding protein